MAKDVKIRITAVAKGAQKVIQGVGNSLKAMGGIASNASKVVGNVFKKIRNLGIAGAAAITGLVKSANDFRKVMAEVSTIAGNADITELTDQVIDLSAELGVAKNELAKGLYQVLSAGIPSGNAIEFLRKSTQAAIAGVTTTETAVTALTKVIDSYGLAAKDVDFVSDRMFTTVKNGVVTFEELAQGMGQISGLAATAGVEFDELMGIFATASKTVNPAELFTALRGTLISITAPAESLQKVFKDMNTTGEALVKERGLVGALKAVEEATGGSLEQMKKLIPNVRALPAILAVTGKNAAKTAKNVEAMADAAGATEKAFQQIDEVRGWPRLWQQILRPVTRLGIVFDKELSPAARKIGEAIAKWQDSANFTKFLATVKEGLQEAQEIVEGIFAGGEQRTKAIQQLKEVGKTVAEELIERAVPIGEAIARAFWSGTKKITKEATVGRFGAAKTQDELFTQLNAANVGGEQISGLERNFPALSNLMSGGEFGQKVDRMIAIMEMQVAATEGLKQPDGS